MNSLQNLFDNYAAKLVLGFVIIFGLAFYFLSFDGYYFYDDLKYMQYAFQVSNRTFHLTTDNFCHRFGLFVPTAILYKLFGINEISSTLWVFLCWAGSVWLCYKITKSNTLSAIAAVILCGLDYYHLFLNNKVYPDMPVTLFTILALYCLHQAYFENKSTVQAALVFSLACLLAFLSKTTIIYLLPFFLVVFVSSMLQKKHLQLWAYTVMFGFGMLVIYFGYYYVYTGNPWYVFSSIENSHYPSSGSYCNKGIRIMVNRLTYEPILMFINCGMIIPILLSWQSFRLLFKVNTWKIQTQESFWMLASASILGMFWLSSLSFNFYSPMTLNPRMVILMVPPLAILAALNFPRMLSSPKQLLGMCIVFGFTALICFQWVHPFKSVVYVVLTLVFLLAYAFKSLLGKQIIVSVGLLIALCIQPLYSMLKPKTLFYKEEKTMFNTYLSTMNKQAITVVTDHRLSCHWQYYFKFKPPVHWKFVYYNDFDLKQVKPNEQVLVLVNNGYSQYLNQYYQGDQSQLELKFQVQNKIFCYQLKH